MWEILSHSIILNTDVLWYAYDFPKFWFWSQKDLSLLVNEEEPYLQLHAFCHLIGLLPTLSWVGCCKKPLLYGITAGAPRFSIQAAPLQHREMVEGMHLCDTKRNILWLDQDLRLSIHLAPKLDVFHESCFLL